MGAAMKNTELLSLLEPALVVTEYTKGYLTHDLAASGDVFYIYEGVLLQGFVNTPNKSERSIAMLKTAGDFAGLGFLFRDQRQPFNTSTEVVGSAKVGRAKREAVERLISRNPAKGYELLFKAVTAENESIARRLEVLSILPPAEQMLATLTELKHWIGVKHAKGTTLPLKVSELAKLMGCSEESARRTKSKLMESEKIGEAAKKYPVLF